MLSINTNLSSLITQRSMKESTNKLNQAIERMTTGAKINHAKDNAANYSICTNMDTKIGALQVAEDNAAMGLDMLATANGTLDQISDKLQRLRNLAVQTSNGTYGLESKQAINSEANALVDEIERLYNTTEYNGIKLFELQTNENISTDFINSIAHRDTTSMTTLASVDETVLLTGGTYSISTPEELSKLARMTNNSLIRSTCEFVLANDIDLEEYLKTNDWISIGCNTSVSARFLATFDGNGYVISNLYQNKDCEKASIGFFGFLGGSSIVKNIGLKDVYISSNYQVGALASYAEKSSITNCWVTGKVFAYNEAGGLIGTASTWRSTPTTITDCWTDTQVYAKTAGGLVANLASANLNNCSVYGTVSGACAGGIAGKVSLTSTKHDNSNITSCHVYGYSSNLSGVLYGRLAQVDELPLVLTLTINDCTYNSNYYEKGIEIGPIHSNVSINNVMPEVSKTINDTVSLQIGINNNKSSTIVSDMYLSLIGISVLSNIGKLPETNINKLETIDYFINMVSEKQLALGTVENRLNSALDEISTQYENLVSSRSTLRDADISEVSSEYIRQQILQQASATLMATANQSASIALSLI